MCMTIAEQTTDADSAIREGGSAQQDAKSL